MTVTTTQRKLGRKPTPAQVRAARALVRWADEMCEGTVDDFVRAVANYRLEDDQPDPVARRRID